MLNVDAARPLRERIASDFWYVRLLPLLELQFTVGTCIFCQIIKGVEPAHKVWESEDFLAFLTRSPCNPGHTLLIPRTHVDYVFDLEEPLYSNIFRAAKQLSEAIKQATDAKRIGVAIEGLSVPHVHLHLVPVYNVAELDPHRHIEQTHQELAAMAGRIRRESVGI